MAEKKLRITVLTDKTSWMNAYNIELVRTLEEQGHSVRLIHAKEELSWRERERERERDWRYSIFS